ncbi:MAG: DUF2147 domain-containing protein [Nitratireductor sp.]|nr:DUF2147 domain-containing protein [Nitratireductor sp.]
MKKFLAGSVLTLALTVSSVAAYAAEPIEGTWLRPSTNTLLKYSKRGGQFCGTVLTGEHKGKSIGCMSGTGASYEGKVIALDEGKTYSGKAKINGNTMKLSGCVLGGMICKGENWKRQ